MRQTNPIILQKTSWGKKSCLFFPPMFKIPGYLHDLYIKLRKQEFDKLEKIQQQVVQITWYLEHGGGKGMIFPPRRFLQYNRIGLSYSHDFFYRRKERG